MDAEKRLIYGMDTTVVRFHQAEYYVPDYARHRPVAQRVLGKRKVARALHRFVGRLMEHRPGSMVHAGAFFGDMLPSFSRKTPGTVHAFEPVIENYLLAQAVVESNGLDNVRLLHCGLGPAAGVSQVGVARADRQRHLGGAARIVTGETEDQFVTQPTAVLTIDQLGIDDLTLIQLDTEGFELPILQGAEEAIRSQSPVIVIEDNKENCREYVSGLGYEAVGLLQGDAVYAAATLAPDVAELVRQSRGQR
ncbi:FkbM family methyltransferase [Nocardioides sp. GXQ0305]|uniref:FkbM family methyltransferase n=1 Tax=Nocardioides sp. GXQ0305 TaxID=3423912 RepID=UPI003D7ECD32